MRLSAEQRRQLARADRELAKTGRLVALVALLGTSGPRWWRRARAWNVLLRHPDSPGAFVLTTAAAVLLVITVGAIGLAAILVL